MRRAPSPENRGDADQAETAYYRHFDGTVGPEASSRFLIIMRDHMLIGQTFCSIAAGTAAIGRRTTTIGRPKLDACMTSQFTVEVQHLGSVSTAHHRPRSMA
jgi:hypothetical protein